MPGQDPMKLYMQEIGQYDLISKERERELSQIIRNGDPSESLRARNELMCANLRLVVKISHDFKGFGLPLLDLISEGNIGMARAAEKFDPAKGAKFSSYAAWWIKQGMRRALANQPRVVRIPVQSAGKIRAISSARMKIAEREGREATDEEVAEETELTVRTIQSLDRTFSKGSVSLEDPIKEGENSTVGELIADQAAPISAEQVETDDSLDWMRELLPKLTERKQTIIQARFLDDPPKTLEQTSKLIGRTRERVRQLQNAALKELKVLMQQDHPEIAEQMESERRAKQKAAYETRSTHVYTAPKQRVERGKKWRKHPIYVFLSKREQRFLDLLNGYKRIPADETISSEGGHSTGEVTELRTSIRKKIADYLRFERAFKSRRKYKIFGKVQTLLYAIIAHTNNTALERNLIHLKNEEERDVLRFLYGLQGRNRKGHQYAAKDLGLEEERVHEIELNAMRRITQQVGLDPDQVLNGYGTMPHPDTIIPREEPRPISLGIAPLETMLELSFL